MTAFLPAAVLPDRWGSPSRPLQFSFSSKNFFCQAFRKEIREILTGNRTAVTHSTIFRRDTSNLRGLSSRSPGLCKTGIRMGGCRRRTADDVWWMADGAFKKKKKKKKENSILRLLNLLVNCPLIIHASFGYFLFLI